MVRGPRGVVLRGPMVVGGTTRLRGFREALVAGRQVNAEIKKQRIVISYQIKCVGQQSAAALSALNHFKCLLSKRDFKGQLRHKGGFVVALTMSSGRLFHGSGCLTEEATFV